MTTKSVLAAQFHRMLFFVYYYLRYQEHFIVDTIIAVDITLRLRNDLNSLPECWGSPIFFLFNSDTQVTDHNGVHSMRHVIECHTIVFVYANDTFENKTNDVLNSLWLPTIAIRTYTWAHTLTSGKNLLTHSVVCCYEYLLCAIILAEHFKMLNVSVINYI